MTHLQSCKVKVLHTWQGRNEGTLRTLGKDVRMKECLIYGHKLCFRLSETNIWSVQHSLELWYFWRNINTVCDFIGATVYGRGRKQEDLIASVSVIKSREHSGWAIFPDGICYQKKTEEWASQAPDCGRAPHKTEV